MSWGTYVQTNADYAVCVVRESLGFADSFDLDLAVGSESYRESRDGQQWKRYEAGAWVPHHFQPYERQAMHFALSLVRPWLQQERAQFVTVRQQLQLLAFKQSDGGTLIESVGVDYRVRDVGRTPKPEWEILANGKAVEVGRMLPPFLNALLYAHGLALGDGKTRIVGQ